MSLTLQIDTGNTTYPIALESSFEKLPQYLQELNVTHKKICIITDTNVEKYQLPLLLDALKAFDTCTLVMEAGEKNKTLETISSLYEQMIDHNLDRSSYLLALGGGVVGDITGFIAATFMRGIGYIQIPTTLLSQVDSSVGGKTGFDFCGHKNIIGAFNQPELVYANTSALKTLPLRELKAGMGEVVKHGIIMDTEYLQYIKDHISEILECNSDVLQHIIYGSCKIKAKVVGEDEKEHGIRAILNFGHTIGHAIESSYNFEYLHGECVAIGIVAAMYISYKKGNIIEESLLDMIQVLKSLGLPTSVPNMDHKTVMAHMLHDKKVKSKSIFFILNEEMGKVYITDDVSEEEIIDALNYISIS